MDRMLTLGCSEVMLAGVVAVVSAATLYLLAYMTGWRWWGGGDRNSLVLSRPAAAAPHLILITGATSGIGEALAHQLYTRGCTLILSGRSETKLAALKAALLALPQSECSEGGVEPLTLPLDLSQPPALIQQAVTSFCTSRHLAAAPHGTWRPHLTAPHGTSRRPHLTAPPHINILINCAGVTSRGSALDTHMSVYEEVARVNYLGQVALTQCVAQRMLSEPGCGGVGREHVIVGISSVQGKLAIPYRAPYGSSKHAVSAYYDTLRAELSCRPAPPHIRVCVLYPGYVRTKLSENAFTATPRQTYGVIDEATRTGMEPRDVAARIIQAIERGEEEVLMCPLTHRAAVVIRALCPALYFYIMRRRAATTNTDPPTN